MKKTMNSRTHTSLGNTKIPRLSTSGILRTDGLKRTKPRETFFPSMDKNYVRRIFQRKASKPQIKIRRPGNSRNSKASSKHQSRRESVTSSISNNAGKLSRPDIKASRFSLFKDRNIN